MLSPTLLPILVALASCAAPVAASRARQACPPLPSYVPSFFRPGVKWQIEIDDPIDVTESSRSVPPADAKVWDVDMYDSIEIDDDDTNSNIISRLRAANPGIFVICYFNAGGFNESDPGADRLNPADKLGKIPGWEEHYLDITSDNVMAIMKDRIDNGTRGGCDAFDPDNIDGYLEPTLVTRPADGHALDTSDYYNYVKVLADYAHGQGKLLGQKNARELLNLADGRGLVNDGIVDFAVTEQCAEGGWCGQMKPFIDCSKPVFQIEYPAEWDQENCAATALNGATLAKYCGFANPPGQNFSTILKLDGPECGLNGVTQYCDSDVLVTTPTVPEDPEDPEE
ncbi:hypothetical protein PG996_008618 [Apiospora saccharicola]|uniref:alpha-galactosidase n=1 Tax=Apiospora saccharicola TaxID=335842 RepID=A0ABR1V0Y8_9PEZI